MRSAKWALPVAVIAVALACVLAPAQALAHGGNPNYRSEIDSIQPPLPSGAQIEVLNYDSYFQLLDQHGHEVVIYGYNDEPYARIEKDGTVQVNETLARDLPQRQPLRDRRDRAEERRPEGAAGMEDGRRLRARSSGTTTGCTG